MMLGYKKRNLSPSLCSPIVHHKRGERLDFYFLLLKGKEREVYICLFAISLLLVVVVHIPCEDI
jgi:hypothetical protein